ncbi:MAG: STAS domain-containing protein [Magnetospirillum sp.]
MQFSLEATGNGLLVSLSGQLDYTATGGFEELMRETREIAPQTLTLDFSRVTWLDSVGLGQLFLMREKLRASQICLSNPKPSIRQLLSLTKADLIFSVV